MKITESLLNTVKNPTKDKKQQLKIAKNIKITTNALNSFTDFYNIVTPRSISAFLAQAAAETDGFLWLEELEWKKISEKEKQAILKGWYWDNLKNKKALGNQKESDSWFYRGRGIFQLTGRGNYEAIETLLSRRKPPSYKGPIPDLKNNPVKARDPYISALIACAFWDMRGIYYLAEDGHIDAVTRKVVGDGVKKEDLKKRKNYYYKLLKACAKLNNIDLTPEDLASEEDFENIGTENCAQHYTTAISNNSGTVSLANEFSNETEINKFITELKNSLHDEQVRFYLISALETQALDRTIEIDGVDKDNNSMKEKILGLSEFLSAEEESNPDSFQHSYEQLQAYLNREEVLFAYLTSLKIALAANEEIRALLSPLLLMSTEHSKNSTSPSSFWSGTQKEKTKGIEDSVLDSVEEKIISTSLTPMS